MYCCSESVSVALDADVLKMGSREVDIWMSGVEILQRNLIAESTLSNNNKNTEKI